MSQTSPRDVVITGIGIISPLGIGRDAFWSGIADGRTGIKRVELLSYVGTPGCIGGEVSDFNDETIKKQHLKTLRKSLKVMCREIQMGVAAALQAMTGNIGILGGCAEGVGKAWHAEAVAYPYDQYANVWFASIKSDRWAHCVLNYPNVKREEIGCWPRQDATDGQIPNIKGIFWQGSDWFNQLTNINKEIAAIRKLELVVCMDSTITPSGLWAISHLVAMRFLP